MKTNAKFTSDTCLKTGAVANTNALSQQLAATNSTQMLLKFDCLLKDVIIRHVASRSSLSNFSLALLTKDEASPTPNLCLNVS